MYSNYQHRVNSMLQTNCGDFKRDGTYNAILEHVSYEQGNSYISCIIGIINEVFPEITFENITGYLQMNDKYGNPKTNTFMYDNKQIVCSPTSLRYVLHSLLILKYIKNTSSRKVVEVGCGYGGLFLGISYFSKILNIEIDNYYFIDLPEICGLIENYLELHNGEININYAIHTAHNYGADIDETGMFFISNYCFTEIDRTHRDNYIKHLFPKISSGFIVWQTVFNLPINHVNIIGKNIKHVGEEYPQTATIQNKNYYVYF